MKTDSTSALDSGHFLLEVENIANLFLLPTSTTNSQRKRAKQKQTKKMITLRKATENNFKLAPLQGYATVPHFLEGGDPGLPCWFTYIDLHVGSLRQTKSAWSLSRLSCMTMTGNWWVLWEETTLIPELWPTCTSNKTLTCSSTSRQPAWWWHTSSTSTTDGVLCSRKKISSALVFIGITFGSNCLGGEEESPVFICYTCKITEIGLEFIDKLIDD